LVDNYLHDATVVRVLQSNDITLLELFTGDEVSPVLGLDVEFFDGVVGVHVPCRSDRHNVCVVPENFESNWAMVFAFVILVVL